MVAVHDISKSFEKGSVRAVVGVSLDIADAELFGIVGPDGAGKTTLFRVLTTLLLPDSGKAKVNGYDVIDDYKAIRKLVGYMPGRFSLYQDLTVEENLNFFATLFNTTVEDNYDQIRDIYVQIEPFKTRRAGKLSGGMKQKLALCCALIHRPMVLFLDEPTTGVDPVSRKEFWEMLQRLKLQGITIVVSTPYMDEATKCDRIALMSDGKLLNVNTPAGLVAEFSKSLYAIRSNNMPQLLNDLRSYDGTESCYSFGEFFHATFDQDTNTDATSYLLSKGHSGVEVNAITPSVEDCFIRLLKKQ